MKRLRIYAFLLAWIYSLNVMAAVNIVECEDEQGNKTFQSACPPGTKQVNEKRVATGTATPTTAGQGSGTNLSATLYYSPNCESCEVVKEYLRNRNIQINEKNVYDNLDLQKELTDLTGKQTVPVTVIGDKVLIGYSRADLSAALATIGYTEPDTTAESASR
ncbi:MAG: glutaredoxin [Gammaproteobacteria bacterium]|nr:glutaredoxin [Gammaproteobacteria bacterium]